MNNGDMSASPLPLATIQDGEVIDTGDYCPDNNGLTKREHFAAMAMSGLMANDSRHIAFHKDDAETMATMAVVNADALLKALEKN